MLSSSPLCKLKSTVHHHPSTTTKRSCHYSFLTSIPSKSLHGRFPPVFYPTAHSSSTTFSGLIFSVPQQSIDLADGIEGKINTQAEGKNPDSSSKAFKTIPKHLRRKRRKPLKISTRARSSVALPLDAVVMVICVSGHPDFSCPWQKKQEKSDSSGFVIGDRRVLTCAHSVDHHTQVMLKNRYSDTLYEASVIAVAPECDIAMLTVCDDEFWKGVKPVEFGGTLAPKDKLTILGCHGESCVYMKRARVTRVGMKCYSHLGAEFLALEVNVTIRNGISGGPVFNKSGKCVGMAFQGAGSTTDVIPTQVIKHFIRDYDKNGAYTGSPNLGINWLVMEASDLRMKRDDQGGVLIMEVMPDYPESDVLNRYDILSRIDGLKIRSDGTVPFKQGRRVDFTYLITKKYVGDEVVLEVLRNSKKQEFTIKLATHKQFKPGNILGRPISYYIVAGLVFTTLSYTYLESLYPSVSGDLMSQAVHEQRVVVCQVLEDDINSGYDAEEVVNFQVRTFNGKLVKSLKDLASMVESCIEEFLEFRLDNRKKLVFQTKNARERSREILKMHCIPSAMSDDLICCIGE
ncbi:protease Do-like 9 isoform X2 [Rhododendron vialii]|uniref:protease Do-like 9 isoform X2 n=1 Tax=Rhododendron vialii TaxID=182163 RepID=UPI0026601E62|nr:protease Do-like 9 isoform X2 [Rhododendron vialii]